MCKSHNIALCSVHSGAACHMFSLAVEMEWLAMIAIVTRVVQKCTTRWRASRVIGKSVCDRRVSSCECERNRVSVRACAPVSM